MPSRYTPSRRSTRRRRPGRRVFTSSIAKQRGTTPIGRTWPQKSLGSFNTMFDPVPGKLKVRLRYNTTINLAPAAGTVANYLFRANSIFKPDFTGAGHQPIGHDQWASFYNRYRVYKCTIVVTALNGQSGIVGLTQDATTVVSVDFDSVLEQKTTRMCQLYGPSETRSVSNVWTDDRFGKGISDSSSSMGSNPGETEYFRVFYRMANTTVSSNADFLISLTYDVELTEPVELNQS